jgi:hypothetical protein
MPFSPKAAATFPLLDGDYNNPVTLAGSNEPTRVVLGRRGRFHAMN